MLRGAETFCFAHYLWGSRACCCYLCLPRTFSAKTHRNCPSTWMAMLLHNASAKAQMKALPDLGVVPVPCQRGLCFLHGMCGEHHDRLLSLLCHVLSLGALPSRGHRNNVSPPLSKTEQQKLDETWNPLLRLLVKYKPPRHTNRHRCFLQERFLYDRPHKASRKRIHAFARQPQYYSCCLQLVSIKGLRHV